MTKMPKNPLNSYLVLITTHYYITAYITITESCILARTIFNQVLSKVHLQDTFGQGGVYLLPVTSIQGRLPVVWVGDTGTIVFSYYSGCCNVTHNYNHDRACADSGRGAA